MSEKISDLIKSLSNLTKEIAKLTESHKALSKDVQAIHEFTSLTAAKCDQLEGRMRSLEIDNKFFVSKLRANIILIFNLPEEEKQSSELYTVIYDVFRKAISPIVIKLSGAR